MSCKHVPHRSGLALAAASGSSRGAGQPSESFLRAEKMPSGRQATLIVGSRHVRADRADRVGRRRPCRAGDGQRRLGRTCWSCSSRIGAVAAAGGGWWLLFPREQQPSLWLCVGLRFVREGANALLPLAQIGGDFIGARCLALRGVRGTLAAASVIVDVLMQAVSQLVFAIIGLILLMAMGGNELVVWPIAVGIALGGAGARRLPAGAG